MYKLPLAARRKNESQFHSSVRCSWNFSLSCAAPWNKFQGVENRW
jgi:hypothetical protein